MHTPRHLREALAPFVDFLFPGLCLVCGKRRESRRSRTCQACWSRVEWISRESPLYRETFGKLQREGEVAGLHSAFVFEREGPLQQMIHALKYGGVTCVGVELGEILAGLVAADAVDAIVPVPLHRVKQRERGYNQAEILARSASAGLGIPVVAGGLVRVRNTATQTHLGREERRANLAGAFTVASPARSAMQGKRLLLVDDVITTGSTIVEAAGTLMGAGAARVLACSVAIARFEDSPTGVPSV